MITIEQVWEKIVELEGEKFLQVRGKTFAYRVSGKSIVPNTTNYIIPRSQFEKAWERFPVTGPGELSDLIAPSYLFAILNDNRIREK